ncbi:DUF4026 domain-containing protein [Anaerocolumna xylanovorans]|uniref:Uncharacterized protein n=1 Tax=Anaerocolumna xylanovorans DSM 12503 TaxID=1121345 RepID=A0A1M7YEP4_9FIRM|nr:DUF4026 domain-containing protein [Anaerocolumna xylanovorans]SHO51112.1 hypothetical protein SAMN02745217_03023 [Anaerocolumna xylanovorans DSM 12503]
MGLFDLFNKKLEKKIQPDNLSMMLAIPEKEDIEDQEILLSRLDAVPEIHIISRKKEDYKMSLVIEYREQEFQLLLYPDSFVLPEFYRQQHLFPDVDMKKLALAESGITVEMLFGENSLESYHLQLKIMHSMLPDMLALLDISSEKILSGRWVAMAAASKVPPAPRYIYTVQAVSDEDEVWLHTHGLNRCGITELEVLHSTKITYNSHYNIIETAANRLLEAEEPIKEKEPLYLARLSEDIYMIITLIPWAEALKEYDEDILGGKNDRKESHNGYTSAIFVYHTEADYKKKKYNPVSIYDEVLKDNPIYMITNAETARMRSLAIERINYVRKALEQEENHILVKIGLIVDEEFQNEDNFHEHIWFELLEFNGNKVTGELTQEPYYVKDMHTGSVGTYDMEDITDWLIFTPERRLSPDDAYLFEMQ